MESSIRNLFVAILLFFCVVAGASAEDFSMRQLTTPTNVAFADCSKAYNIPAEHLYYLTIDSITANHFEIKELQSKMGYVLFRANEKDFLASIFYYGDNKSLLKITPINSNYYFAPGIVSNIFKYVDLNYVDPILSIQKS